ncbi:MAG: hypothetical protein IPJ20_13660 [Flammeovirgaceae bacterium]|nr:hypothetical protein [Flammeovirgaceae bacterium]
MQRLFNFSSSLAWTGKMNWQSTAPHAGTNISIIPYAIASTSKDNESGTSENKLNGGFDRRWALHRL